MTTQPIAASYEFAKRARSELALETRCLCDAESSRVAVGRNIGSRFAPRFERQTLVHFTRHGITFTGPPSKDIRNLAWSCFAEGES